MATNTTFTMTLAPSVTPIGAVVGKVVYDSTAITTTDYSRFEVGFKPRSIEFVNATDRIKIEWKQGMDSSTRLRTVAAGTVTLDATTDCVKLDERGFSLLQDTTAAVIAASKTCYFTVLP